jgi:hypothetical protein
MMKGIIVALVAGLTLALATAGPAFAGGGQDGQSQSAVNSIDQTASAQAVSVNLSPNVAVLNGGNVDQSSGSTAVAGAANGNSSSQTNNQSQSSGQDESASNSVDQSASAKALSVNASPNIAAGNGLFDKTDGCGCGYSKEKGGVEQSSGSTAVAGASNWNSSSQTNNQSQSGGQDDVSCSCDSYGKDGKGGQDASNSVDQTAKAKAISVNASPNVAVLNGGNVKQSSGSTAVAGASNWNSSSQTNNQSQSGGQDDVSCSCDSYGKDGKGGQDASNSVDQTAKAKAISVNASPNVAVLNGGNVKQSSGSTAVAGASNWNSSSQTNNQSQTGTQPCPSSCSQCGGGCSPCSTCSPRPSCGEKHDCCGDEHNCAPKCCHHQRCGEKHHCAAKCCHHQRCELVPVSCA